MHSHATGSPAEGKLQPGDILLRIGSSLCEVRCCHVCIICKDDSLGVCLSENTALFLNALQGFISLEAALDDAQAAGSDATLHIERGGEPMVVQSSVVSLHSCTRSTLLEASGAIFHALTLQQARHYNIPVEGVYLAHAVSPMSLCMGKDAVSDRLLVR